MKVKTIFEAFRKWKDQIPGGKADDSDPDDFDQKGLKMGAKIEKNEHGDEVGEEIAADHCKETQKETGSKKPCEKYYKKLKASEKEMKMEKEKDGKA